MGDAEAANKRRYRGMDGDERLALRRAALIEAGLELFGTAGYGRTTVDDICRRAGVAKRYFYESFKDREALLVAVYEAEIEYAQVLAADAVRKAGASIEDQIHAGLDALIRYFCADPRKGRIAFIEIIRAGESVEHHYRDAKHRFADFIITILVQTLDIPRTARIELGTAALVGAVNEVVTDWLGGSQRSTVDEIIEACALVFELLYRQYLRELGLSSAARPRAGAHGPG